MSKVSYEKHSEPFDQLSKTETRQGMSIQVGKDYLIKHPASASLPAEDAPNLPAKVESIWWDPVGFERDDDGLINCHLAVELIILDGKGNEYLDGRHKKIYGWNLDYWIRETVQIK